ncbi:MAG: efflux RND transporter periplasmic adaptor subunit [Fusobacteriaceae bacterium]
MKRNIFIILISIFFIIAFKYCVHLRTSPVVMGLKVVPRSLTEKIVVSGIVTSEKTSSLATEVVGKVENIFYKEGDLVKKDDLILSLDTSKIDREVVQGEYNLLMAKNELLKLETTDIEIAQAEYLSAKDNFNIYKEQYVKYKKLYDKSLVSVLEFQMQENLYSNAKNRYTAANSRLNSLKSGSSKEILKNTVEIANENLNVLKKQREKYTIRAPYDAIITRKKVNLGEIVESQSELFTIYSLEGKYIDIDLDEKYLTNTKLKNNVKIYKSNDKTNLTDGEIYYFGPDISKDNGTTQIKAKFLNNETSFLFGSTVNVIIEGDKFENSLIISNDYILNQDLKNYVYIVKNRKIIKKEVELKPVINDNIVISGLESGDIIINNFTLPDGTEVNVKEDVQP